MKITPRYILLGITEFYYEVYDMKTKTLIPMTKFQWNIKKNIYIDVKNIEEG